MESKNARSHGPFEISNPHIHYSYAIWSCGGFKVKACEIKSNKVDMESGYSVVVKNHYFLLAGLYLIQEKYYCWPFKNCKSPRDDISHLVCRILKACSLHIQCWDAFPHGIVPRVHTHYKTIYYVQHVFYYI